ncbi:hypothetical protein CTA2_9490 [Colletotrichum tanaceti]|uniref:BTB domain-containing protein n=1 Tax=Colletotrichum tanaceti TaxID=1306861 RepID=A0A4V6DHC7_9PEZI|nr:hypothetical protein CTA2_9490 [Colletotrichum tanaceti]TKW56156.1 hypothetical protein CTA1_2981 [Colletotrichum tanaceti]
MMSDKAEDAIDLERIRQSRIVKFVVGPDEKEFSVHEFSLCAISPGLRELLTGGWKESVEGKVVWIDVEPATFVRLMEYAYYHDYSVPKVARTTTLNDCDEPDDSPDSLESYLQSSTHQGAQHQFGKKCFTQPLGLEFGQGSHPNNEAAYLRTDWLEDIKSSKTGMADVLMSQVKLYTLANHYGIEGLRSLCLHRLQQSLLHCPGTSEFMDIFLDVVELVFSRTRPQDPLRKLLVCYCVTDLEWATAFKRYRDLIEKLPGFASAILSNVPLSYWNELSNGISSTVLPSKDIDSKP